MKSATKPVSTTQVIEKIKEVIMEGNYDTSDYLSILQFADIPVDKKEDIQEILVENTGDNQFADGISKIYHFFNSANELFEHILLQFLDLCLIKNNSMS